MVSKEFSKEDLLEMLHGHSKTLKSVENKIIETTRWSIVHDVVFKELITGNFYNTTYSVGATEQQDESPFEYAGDMIECVQVEPKEIVVIEYVPV